MPGKRFSLSGLAIGIYFINRREAMICEEVFCQKRGFWQTLAVKPPRCPCWAGLEVIANEFEMTFMRK